MTLPTSTPKPAPATPALRITRPHRPSPGFFSLVPDPRKPGASYDPFPMQRKIHYSKALYRVACLGRQVGKSELASVEAAYELTMHPGSSGWIVAPIFEQAQVIFKRTLEKVEAIAEQLPHLKIKARKGATLEIEVTHYDRPWRDKGARVVGKSTFNGRSGQNPDNLRGATLTYLIVDETAMMGENVWFEGLKPMLSTTQGWVLFVSTPKGFNWFHEMFLKGESTEGENVAWESFRAPSWDANPTVPRAYYEGERLVLPDLLFRQEYGAEFVSTSGSVFQGVDACPRVPVNPHLSAPVDGVLISRPVDPAARYVVGADFGRLQDYTVYTVMDLDSREMVASYRYPFVDWDRQLLHLERVSREWNNALVVGDNNGVGDYLEQQARKLGIPFEGLKFTGSQVKSEVINHLAIGMEHGYVAIQDDPELIKELQQFKYSKTEGGTLKMQAEGRGHDDRVISLALAYSKFGHTGVLPLTPQWDQASAQEQDPTFRAFEKIDAVQSMHGKSELLGSLSFGLAELDRVNASLLGT